MIRQNHLYWTIFDLYTPFIYFFLDKKLSNIYMYRVSSTIIPPIFLHTYCTLIISVHYIVHCSIPLPMQKIIRYKFYGMYLLTPTRSTSVEIFVSNL